MELILTPWHAPPDLVSPSHQLIGLTLVITGVFAGFIHRVGTPLTYNYMTVNQRNVVKFLMEGLRFAAEARGSLRDDELLSFIFQTVECGHHTVKPQAEQGYLLRGMRELLDHYRLAVIGGWKISSEWSTHALEFLKSGMRAAIGRKWCIADKGSVGIVPGSATSGAHIVIFDGFPLPFVLKSHSESESTSYRLAGHGYFHDLEEQIESSREELDHRKIFIK